MSRPSSPQSTDKNRHQYRIRSGRPQISFRDSEQHSQHDVQERQKVTTVLNCGHIVEKPYHRESSAYTCTKICKKSLPCGHLCRRKCHINHDPHHLKYVCRERCKKVALGCPYYHPCPRRCHEPCQVCTTKVPKKRTCGHILNVKCSQNVEKIICIELGKRDLPCGHSCMVKCTAHPPYGKCKEMVNKIIPSCGHEVIIPCSEKATAAICKGQCPRTLKCGHPCAAKCCNPCTKECKYPRPLPKLALCQHVFPVPCYKIEVGLAEYADKLLQHCPTPCATLLPCGHMCSGSCGSCKQGRIHQLCREQCNKILICGHKCESPCKDYCRPCQKICFLRCEHIECKKKCGLPCTPCREPCSWKCQHFKCKKLCFEKCDKDFCDEPCSKRLKCGHPCIGFCGEPCPPLCRICDAKDLPTFNIDKNKPDPRFVFLPECGHSIESNYLDWIWQRSYKIGIKVCPLCKTRITYCKRYTNHIKQECKNIDIVDQEVSLVMKNLQSDQREILSDINVIEKQYAAHFPGVNAHKKFFESLRTRTNQRKTISVGLLKDIGIKLTISVLILQKLQEIPPPYHTVDNWPVVLNQMIILITSIPTTRNISRQMIDDVENELYRLHYMVQLCKFEREKEIHKKENEMQVEIIYLGLLNLRKFENFRSDAIYKQLLDLKNSLKSSVPVEKLKDFKITIGFEHEAWHKCWHGHIYLTKCEQCQLAVPPSAAIE